MAHLPSGWCPVPHARTLKESRSSTTVGFPLSLFCHGRGQYAFQGLGAVTEQVLRLAEVGAVGPTSAA